MNKNLLLPILIIIGLFTFSVTTAQNNDKKEPIEKELEQIMQEEKVPGIQIVHFKNGSSKSYTVGYKKYGTKDKITNHTVFQSASLSKSVMAYAVLKLYEKGIIDLDTPLYKYWQYPRVSHEPKAKLMTARMALTHTTGLPNWTKPRGADLKSAFTPGTDFKYSGEGYLYLQKVIEQITGKSLEKIAQEEVFGPLGMKESHYIYKNDIEPNYAYGHDELKAKPLRKFDTPNGAYSLITTAQDYSIFIQEVLVKGQGINAQTYQMMTGYSSSRSPRVGYGMGVMIQRNKQGKGIAHTGSNPGFRSFYFVYPDTGESIVCFTNGTNGEKIRQKVAKLFFGEQTFWTF